MEAAPIIARRRAAAVGLSTACLDIIRACSCLPRTRNRVKRSKGTRPPWGRLAVKRENPRLPQSYRAARGIPPFFGGKLASRCAAAAMSRCDKRKGVETSPDNRRNVTETPKARRRVIPRPPATHIQRPLSHLVRRRIGARSLAMTRPEASAPRPNSADDPFSSNECFRPRSNAAGHRARA
jgi:hypothetical protein